MTTNRQTHRRRKRQRRKERARAQAVATEHPTDKSMRATRTTSHGASFWIGDIKLFGPGMTEADEKAAWEKLSQTPAVKAMRAAGLRERQARLKNLAREQLDRGEEPEPTPYMLAYDVPPEEAKRVRDERDREWNAAVAAVRTESPELRAKLKREREEYDAGVRLWRRVEMKRSAHQALTSGKEPGYEWAPLKPNGYDPKRETAHAQEWSEAVTEARAERARGLSKPAEDLANEKAAESSREPLVVAKGPISYVIRRNPDYVPPPASSASPASNPHDAATATKKPSSK